MLPHVLLVADGFELVFAGLLLLGNYLLQLLHLLLQLGATVFLKFELFSEEV